MSSIIVSRLRTSFLLLLLLPWYHAQDAVTAVFQHGFFNSLLFGCRSPSPRPQRCLCTRRGDLCVHGIRSYALDGSNVARELLLHRPHFNIPTRDRSIRIPSLQYGLIIRRKTAHRSSIPLLDHNALNCPFKPIEHNGQTSFRRHQNPISRSIELHGFPRCCCSIRR